MKNTNISEANEQATTTPIPNTTPAGNTSSSKCFIHKGTLFVPKNDKDALASLKELASQMCQLLDVHELTMTYDCDVTISTEDDSFFLDGEDSNMLPTDIDNCNTIDFLFWRSDDMYSNDKFSLVFNKADSTQMPDYYVFEASRIDSDIRKPYSTSWLHNELDRISKVFDIYCTKVYEGLSKLKKEETVKGMFSKAHFSVEDDLLLLDKSNTGKGIEFFMSAVLSHINANTPGWILPDNCIKNCLAEDKLNCIRVSLYNPLTGEEANIYFLEEYRKTTYRDSIAFSYFHTHGSISEVVNKLMQKMGFSSDVDDDTEMIYSQADANVSDQNDEQPNEAD